MSKTGLKMHTFRAVSRPEIISKRPGSAWHRIGIQYVVAICTIQVELLYSWVRMFLEKGKHQSLSTRDPAVMGNTREKPTPTQPLTPPGTPPASGITPTPYFLECLSDLIRVISFHQV